MGDVTEGLGGIVEGALVGGALEKERGSGGVGANAAEGACLNCGAEPLGNFCQECGQKVHVHRTLSAIGHDIVHGVLHLDGKFWRTLPMLVFKPGHLTRRYIDGQRARFVSPIALFLFSIFLMFAIFQFAGITTPTSLPADRTNEVVDQALDQIATLQDRRDETASRIDSGELVGEELASARAELTSLDDQIEAIEAAEQVPVLRELLQQTEAATEAEDRPVLIESNEDGETTIPLSADGNAQVSIGSAMGITFVDELVGKWRSNPTLMLYKMQTNFYKFSWLLIPLSIPFVWLLFAWKRRFKAYDHAIFVTYSLSFMTMLILTVTLLGMVGAHEIIVFFATVLIPPIHIYKHLRGTYELSRFAALWRLLLLMTFVLVVLVLFLQLLFLIGSF